MKTRIITLLAFSLASTMTFAAGSFTYNDGNDDGKISKDEYYGTLSDAGIYSDWDTDNDGLLTEEEFDEIGYDYDFGAWDYDDNEYLDATELYEGYYDTYDEDEDGHWNAGEWDDAGDDGFFDV